VKSAAKILWSLNMRRTLTLVIALTALLAPIAAEDRGEPRVVMISIDGLMPSSYTSPSSPAPNLKKLMAEGAWAEGVIGVLPTVTYPSHTTLITGVEPSVHGIVDNRILDPENKSQGAWFWYARDIKVPTLPMAARARGLRAAAVTWPVTIGMDLDYVVPEYFRSSHQTDRDRTDLTKFIVKTFDPHVMLLHLIDLDHDQHEGGPGSPQALETLARLDGYVGEIVDAIKTSGRPTHIVIASDHGFLPLKTMLQPNAAFKREGLLTVNERDAVTSWKAYFHSSGGSGFVYVKDPADRERVHKILVALKQDPANGIREVWTRGDLDAKGAHPDAAFGLDVVDGFYTGGGTDVVVKPSGTKGGHGFAPDRTALHSSFIISGPAVQRRGNLGVIRMTQIAPTLAQILGVGLSPAAAKPLQIGTAAEATTGARQ
jgi:predicted AlkP superfamily pyrophosphatase or phosphodiesterase